MNFKNIKFDIPILLIIILGIIFGISYCNHDSKYSGTTKESRELIINKNSGKGENWKISKEIPGPALPVFCMLKICPVSFLWTLQAAWRKVASALWRMKQSG